MNTIITAFRAEWIKLRRTKVVWIITGIYIFMPLMMGLLAYISMHPEVADKSVLINMKAGLFGKNDWQGYMIVLIQAGAGVGLMGTGFIAAYIFGREYTDRTLKDLLALPVPRTAIVYGKFALVFLLGIFLFAVLYAVGIASGILVGIPRDKAVFHILSRQYAWMTVLTVLTTTPVAFFACYGKGVFAPLGFCIVTLILANLVGTIGIGPYFPWAIPGLAGMASAEPGMKVGLTGYVILAMTVAAGFYLTLRHWNHADHQ